MKNRIIVAAAGLLVILMAWVFVPDKTEVSAVLIEEPIDIPKITFSVMTKESMHLKGVEQKRKEEAGSERQAEKAIDILFEDEGGIDEQEASEEIELWSGVSGRETGVVYSVSTAPDTGGASVTEICETWVAETVAYETESQGTEDIVGTAPVEECGAIDIYGHLRRQLAVAGIEWWYPYAVAQMTQESHCNPWAENPNGLDKGLFQYRITYWTEPESIFDISAQIRVYVGQVSARLAAGLSIEETISRHYTSDYVTTVNWQYVNDVLRWMN